MHREDDVNTNPARAYVGTSGWKKPQWRGGFYPHGLVQSRELEFASRQLTSLEINATFRRLQSPSSFEKWYAETPDGFVFSVKAHWLATRSPHLSHAGAPVANFFASGVLRLEEKLGPILWQFPPELEFRSDEVESFIALLPRTNGGRPVRHAIEARNATFTNPEFIALLRANNIAAAFTNAPDLPVIREATADFVYARLHSGDEHHSDGYDDASLDEWSELANGWMRGEPLRDVFVYFNNPGGVLAHTPINATRLLERLRDEPHPQLGD
jgi:uncharacterized protein YecE (DUF72 family)